MLSTSFIREAYVNVSVAGNSASVSDSKIRNATVKLYQNIAIIDGKPFSDLTKASRAVKDIVITTPDKKFIVKINKGTNVQRLVDFLEMMKSNSATNIKLIKA